LPHAAPASRFELWPSKRNEALMQNRKGISIGLLVLALVLLGVQAGVWVKATSAARTETDKQNILGRHQPNETAGIVGLILLVGAAVVASTPQHERRIPTK
jgi:hypothetical protein